MKQGLAYYQISEWNRKNSQQHKEQGIYNLGCFIVTKIRIKCIFQYQ